MSPSTERSSGPKRRIVRAGVAALRITDAIGEAVAPGLTARAAARRWFQIPDTPDTPATRHGDSLGLRRGFQLRDSSLGHRIRGTSWGRGRVVYLHARLGGVGRTDGRPAGAAAGGNYRVVVFDAPSRAAAPTRVPRVRVAAMPSSLPMRSVPSPRSSVRREG